MTLDRLPARSSSGAFHVVVESPARSAVKIKFDPALGAFCYSRPLVTGLTYPFDWGFVPGTRAPDGDPLDAMVLSDAPTATGVVIACRALGVLRLTQREPGRDARERNDRVIAVPVVAPRWNDVREIPFRLRAELEAFFCSATVLEGKDVQIEGWDGPAEGESRIDRAAAATR